MCTVARLMDLGYKHNRILANFTCQRLPEIGGSCVMTQCLAKKRCDLSVIRTGQNVSASRPAFRASLSYKHSRRVSAHGHNRLYRILDEFVD